MDVSTLWALRRTRQAGETTQGSSSQQAFPLRYARGWSHAAHQCPTCRRSEQAEFYLIYRFNSIAETLPPTSCRAWFHSELCSAISESCSPSDSPSSASSPEAIDCRAAPTHGRTLKLESASSKLLPDGKVTAERASFVRGQWLEWTAHDASILESSSESWSPGAV